MVQALLWLLIRPSPPKLTCRNISLVRSRRMNSLRKLKASRLLKKPDL